MQTILIPPLLIIVFILGYLAGLNNAKKFIDGAAKKAVKDALDDLNDEGKARMQ